jgi:hypothetical protein
MNKKKSKIRSTGFISKYDLKIGEYVLSKFYFTSRHTENGTGTSTDKCDQVPVSNFIFNECLLLLYFPEIRNIKN